MNRSTAQLPQAHLDSRTVWQVCTPATIKQFSAVAFHFGKRLVHELDVPIGLINTSYGGTPIEAWTALPALREEPSIKRFLEQWDQRIVSYDPKKAEAEYDKVLKEWSRKKREAQRNDQPIPRRPRRPPDPRYSPHAPGHLYNAMIAPLTRFGMRGVIWYQGESNAGRAYQYRALFPLMIRNWREAWKREFPFYFVQLANFRPVREEPGDSAWAELRDAQLRTHRGVENTGMAVIIDIGEAKDIHPRNKHDVGKRLALWALAKEYGRDVVPSGPLYRSKRADPKQKLRIRIRFDHVGGGLKSRDGEPLKGIAIAGEDRNFVWAQAKIDGDEVVVWSGKVPKPVAVRYAWADNPVCNLVNAEGLPASPFRTDDWRRIGSK